LHGPPRDAGVVEDPRVVLVAHDDLVLPGGGGEVLLCEDRVALQGLALPLEDLLVRQHDLRGAVVELEG